MTGAPRKVEVAVALDVPTTLEAIALVERIGPERAVWKIGLELFIAAGPTVVREVVGMGGRVFLDLKLHDIPQTVARAVAAAGGCGARWLTVHAAGGEAMLSAAREAAPDRMRLLAVTVLTSLDAAAVSRVLGRADARPADEAVRLARLAQHSGVSGVVCSGAEAGNMRRELGADAYLVTPGIRPAGTARGDQARVTTPAEAVRAGADMLVVGRPVTRAEDPRSALESILMEIDR